METEYSFPTLDLLTEDINEPLSEEEAHKTAYQLQQFLTSFKIGTKVTGVVCGPVITRYELKPDPGTSIKDIQRRRDDISLQLGGYELTINPVYEKGIVAIDVVNTRQKILRLRSVLETSDFQNCNYQIPVIMGYDKSGTVLIEDMTELMHILIGGTLGTGKTMLIHSFLMGVLYKLTPDEVQCMIINPARSDMAVYDGIPHLILPVITQEQEAVKALDMLIPMMNSRYRDFAGENVRNITEYNACVRENKYNRIVVIIDNISDISKDGRDQMNDRLDQLLRRAAGAGIHFIIVSTIPAMDVVSGSVKANIPTRISFHLRSRTDSQMILDMAGAEALRGNGDLLLLKRGGYSSINIQGAFVAEKEVLDVADYVRKNNIRKNRIGSESSSSDSAEEEQDRSTEVNENLQMNDREEDVTPLSAESSLMKRAGESILSRFRIK